jgi:type VI secretion system protein VasG
VVSAIRPILSKHFKPALLGRMQVVPFFPLAPEFLQQIVRLKLRQIENRLQDSHRMRMTIDPSVEETIARRCTDVDAGARNIDHIIQQTLLPMLSTALLERMAEAALPSSVRIGIGSDESFTLDFGAPPEVSR